MRASTRCALAQRLVFVATLIAPGRARGQSAPAPRMVSAWRGDLAPGIESEPMPGFALAGALAPWVGYAGGGGASPARLDVGADVVVSAGAGLFQVDAALPLRLGFDPTAGGGMRTAPAVGGLRLGGRAALSRRDPGLDGGALSLSLRVETPWAGASDAGRRFVYRPGVLADYRLRRVYVVSFASLPIQPAANGRPLELRAGFGAGLGVLACEVCRLSLGVAADGEARLLGGGPTSGTGNALVDPPMWARIQGVLQIDLRSGVGIHFHVGTSLYPSDIPSRFVGVALSFALGTSPAVKRGPWPIPELVEQHQRESQRERGLQRERQPARERELQYRRELQREAARKQESEPRGYLVAGAGDLPPGLVGSECPVKLDAAAAFDDATKAIAIAHQSYLDAALADRGLEALREVLVGTAAGAAISAALIGLTFYYGLSLKLTILFLQWLGVLSLTEFTSDKLEQVSRAFLPFLTTVAHSRR